MSRATIPITAFQDRVLSNRPAANTYRFFIRIPNNFEGVLVKQFDCVPFPEFQNLQHLLLIIHKNNNFHRVLLRNWFTQVDLTKSSTHTVYYNTADPRAAIIPTFNQDPNDQ